MTLEQFQQILNSITPDDDGCHYYPGVRPDYYFSVEIKGRRKQKVNRLALELKLGRPILPGRLACHTCDHPNCVNQDHLYEGTHRDNTLDALARTPGYAEHIKRIPKIGGQAQKKKRSDEASARCKLVEDYLATMQSTSQEVS